MMKINSNNKEENEMNMTDYNDFLTEIKNSSFWKVIIRPQKFIENRISGIDKLSDIITNNNVRLRGWNYPHLDHINIVFRNDFMGSWVEFLQLKEIWKFYISGQFENYFAFWEDIYNNKKELLNRVHGSLIMFMKIRNKVIKTNKFLEVDSTIYRIAEIYLFALNLAQNKILGDNIVIEIELLNTTGRVLFIWDIGRELHDIYDCSDDIKIKKTVTKTQLIGENDNLIVETSLDIFHRFGWINIDSSLIINILNKFKDKRF
jgi:hypothetical protein